MLSGLAKALLLVGVVVLCKQQAFSQVPPGRPGAEMPPRTDALGDLLPRNCLGRLGTPRLFHPSGGYSVAFASNCKVLASGGGNGTIRLWDIESGNELACFDDHHAEVRSLVFSHDGKLLASGDGFLIPRICIHDVTAGKVLHFLDTAEQPVGALVFSRDNKSLKSVAGDRIWSWDTKSGKVTGKTQLKGVDPHGPKRRAWAPDGDSIALSDENGIIRLFDAASGEPRLELKGHTDVVDWFAFSADGQLLASHGRDNTVRVWDLATGKQRKMFDNRDELESLQFSPDGKLFATMTEDGTTRVWDAATGEVRHRFEAHKFCSQITFSPDSKLLARNAGHVDIWDISTGKPLHPSPGHFAEVCGAAISPDDKLLVSLANDLAIRLWNLRDGKEVRRISLDDDAILTRASPLFTSDGKSLIWAVGRKVYIAEAASGANETCLKLDDDVNSLAVSPIGKGLAISCQKSIQIWDYQTRKLLATLKDGLRTFRRSVAFAPDGKSLLSASTCDEGHEVQIWDIGTANVLAKFDDDPEEIRCATLSPNGQYVAMATRANVWLCNARTCKKLRRIDVGDNAIDVLCFSPDCKTLASAGGDDATKVRCWEVATGVLRDEFTGHRAAVECLVFSHDGRRLISGSCDSTCLIWDVTGRSSPDGLAAGKVSADEWETFWAKLAGGDAHAAHDAVWALVAADGTGAKMVARLQAIRTLDKNEIAAMVANLDSESFEVRNRAAKELRRGIEMAAPVLRRALEDGPSLEVQDRIKQLLQGIEELPPEHLQLWRATEVLEQIGTPEARKALQILADGFVGSRITREAKAALNRLAENKRVGPRNLDGK
jgi:WD40 repeat protein